MTGLSKLQSLAHVCAHQSWYQELQLVKDKSIGHWVFEIWTPNYPALALVASYVLLLRRDDSLMVISNITYRSQKVKCCSGWVSHSYSAFSSSPPVSSDLFNTLLKHDDMSQGCYEQFEEVTTKLSHRMLNHWATICLDFHPVSYPWTFDWIRYCYVNAVIFNRLGTPDQDDTHYARHFCADSEFLPLTRKALIFRRFTSP